MPLPFYTPDFCETVIGSLISGVQLVECLDEKRTAPARRVENSDACEFVLPRFPEFREGLTLRIVDSIEIVDTRVIQRFYRSPGRITLVQFTK